MNTMLRKSKIGKALFINLSALMIYFVISPSMPVYLFAFSFGNKNSPYNLSRINLQKLSSCPSLLTHPSQKVLILYDAGNRTTSKTKQLLTDTLGKEIPFKTAFVESVEHLETILLSPASHIAVAVYAFHGTTTGIIIGDDFVSWASLSDIINQSEIHIHQFLSCYSCYVHSDEKCVLGHEGKVDYMIAGLSAAHTIAEFYECKSAISRIDTLTEGMKEVLIKRAICPIEVLWGWNAHNSLARLGVELLSEKGIKFVDGYPMHKWLKEDGHDNYNNNYYYDLVLAEQADDFLVNNLLKYDLLTQLNILCNNENVRTEWLKHVGGIYIVGCISDPPVQEWVGTVAQSAEEYFEMAVKKWLNGEYSKAAEHLSFAVHYLEDATNPYHTYDSSLITAPIDVTEHNLLEGYADDNWKDDWTAGAEEVHTITDVSDAVNELVSFSKAIPRLGLELALIDPEKTTLEEDILPNIFSKTVSYVAGIYQLFSNAVEKRIAITSPVVGSGESYTTTNNYIVVEGKFNGARIEDNELKNEKISSSLDGNNHDLMEGDPTDLPYVMNFSDFYFLDYFRTYTYIARSGDSHNLKKIPVICIVPHCQITSPSDGSTHIRCFTCIVQGITRTNASSVEVYLNGAKKGQALLTGYNDYQGFSLNLGRLGGIGGVSKYIIKCIATIYDKEYSDTVTIFLNPIVDGIDPSDMDLDCYKAEYAGGLDCNDNDPKINPAATEVCDGIDNNCNGQKDEGVLTTFYPDADSDDYGDFSKPLNACTAPEDYVINNTDCNDNDPKINPAATEVCDGVDNNCNGEIDEGVKTIYYRDVDGDGYGVDGDTRSICIAEDEYRAIQGGDCNDNDANIYPGAKEVCNEVDDDCDDYLDEEGAEDCTIYYKDEDGDTYGIDENVRCLCGPDIIGKYTAIQGGDPDDSDPGNPVAINMQLDSGWSMISLPLIPQIGLVSEKLFPENLVIYGYKRDVGYLRIKEEENMEVGGGYWILLEEEKSYTLFGQPIESYTFPVLEDGWAMIGGCTSPSQALSNGCDIDVIYGYAQGIGYKRILESEHLEPCKGYWILFSDVMDQAELTIEAIRSLSGVSGVLTDSNGYPIKDVKVSLLLDYTSKAMTNTDETGFYKVLLPEPINDSIEVYVTFKKSGYLARGIKTTIYPDQLIQEDIVFEKVPQVKVYQDCGFGGYAVPLSLDSYNTADLEALGAKDNDISSMTIPAGYQVMLYDQDNFKEKLASTNIDISCFVDYGWNDRVSSIQVRCVTVFSENNWCCGCGRCANFPVVGKYRLADLIADGMKDKDVSSITIPSRYRVILYDEDDFQGESIVLNDHVKRLADIGWDNRTTSLIIEGK